MCLPAVSHRRATADRGTNGEHSEGSPPQSGGILTCTAPNAVMVQVSLPLVVHIVPMSFGRMTHFAFGLRHPPFRSMPRGNA
jgi:hypothetical protein